MEYLLKSDKATAVVSNDKAEIHSFKLNNSECEYMWQGDAKYWAGRNPILFPQVGNTYDKVQRINGKEYHMGNHGLARHAKFTCLNHNGNKVSLVFESDAATKELYPFDFALYVEYTLEGSRLSIDYRIENKSSEEMPFGFGLHPAFNCPIDKGEDFSDYWIAFSAQEDQMAITTDCLIDNKLPLTRNLFNVFPTVIYKGLNSSNVRLTNGKHTVEVGVANYPYLAFWSPSDAPFVCIEPWYSHGDFTKVDKDFSQREGMITLNPGESFYATYYIEILN